MKAYFQELFRTELYKRSQGRMTRQATFFAVAGILLFGWYLALSIDRGVGAAVEGGLSRLLSGALQDEIARDRMVSLTRYALLLLGGGFVAWACYRLVQMPSFADFLIAVEAEVSKVIWPSREKLLRSTSIVILLMFGLSALLFAYDFVIRGVLDLVSRAFGG